MSFRSIKTKIAVVSGVCLLASIILLAGWSLISAFRTSAFVQANTEQVLNKKAEDYLASMAGEQAKAIYLEFRRALDAARGMATAFSVLAANDSGLPPEARRNDINRILEAVLKREPSLNGTYTAWEPNALDGADARYRNRRETGTDATGRYLPYWNRDKNGHIAMQPLVEYDSRALHPNGVMKGGWYIGPQENGRESVLDPLPYIVQGRNVYLATVSVPIVIDDRFKGVAGADFDLDFLQKIATDVSKAAFNGRNSVSIISNPGLVVASSDHADMIGKSYQSLSGDWQTDLLAVQQGAPPRWSSIRGATSCAPSHRSRWEGPGSRGAC